MEYSEGKMGRIFVLRLHDGDRLPNVLEKFAEQHNVRSALCFLLGGINQEGRIVAGPHDKTKRPISPIIEMLQGVHEIAAIGTMFPDEDGKPKLHMHGSFGRARETITGCIRLGIEVWQLGEVVMLEIADSLSQRVSDEKMGFTFLEFKKQ